MWYFSKKVNGSWRDPWPTLCWRTLQPVRATILLNLHIAPWSQQWWLSEEDVYAIPWNEWILLCRCLYFFLYNDNWTTTSETEEASSGAALHNLNCFTLLAAACLRKFKFLSCVGRCGLLMISLFSLFSRSLAEKLHNENMNWLTVCDFENICHRLRVFICLNMPIHPDTGSCLLSSNTAAQPSHKSAPAQKLSNLICESLCFI